jgi:hypothetical protein
VRAADAESVFGEAAYLFSVLPAACRQHETMLAQTTCRQDTGSTLEHHHEAPLNRGPMRDFRKEILKAEPKRLAALLEIDQALSRVWRSHELAAILKHQLTAPVELDLAEGSAGQTAPSPTQFPEIGSFDELFHHPAPPIELLRSVKEFAKANRNHPASALPNEIATLLYYASVIVARWRCGEVITTLNDEELGAGIGWAIAQPWVDERTRSLLYEASKALNRSTS